MFLCIAITAFVSCVLSLQAAGSRLLYAFARDRMLPGSTWLSKMSERHAVPANAAGRLRHSILICLYVYANPNQLPRITAFAVLGIYIAFQAVVLAALRQRLRGWRPAGDWNLGLWGKVVNIGALTYGALAMVLLIKPPPGTETFIDRWVVAVGLVIVVGTGLLYMFAAKPYRHPTTSARTTPSKSPRSCAPCAAPDRRGHSHLAGRARQRNAGRHWDSRFAMEPSTSGKSAAPSLRTAVGVSMNFMPIQRFSVFGPSNRRRPTRSHIPAGSRAQTTSSTPSEIWTTRSRRSTTYSTPNRAGASTPGTRRPRDGVLSGR